MLAEAFALGSFRIEADRRSNRRYGACFRDGVIRIRLEGRRDGRPLRTSSLVNTLCHELAHLRHFNHGPGFKAFYFSLLRWAKERGLYAPRRLPARLPASVREPKPAPAPAAAPAPTQLSLFR
ncbi:MAG: hypothetical protein AABZ30_07980 [Myxococcota bacterium]